MSQQNVEALRRAFEAFARGDIDAVLELVDDDAKWEPAVAPILGVEYVRGKDALRRFFTRDLFEGFDRFQAEPLSFEDLGEKVLVMTRYVGRGETTGLRIDQTFAALYTFKGDKLVAFRDYATRAEALEGVGLSE